MSNPLFSVCIANYNNGRFLKETIDSIIHQTYSNWEIIIVDDASMDNSRKVYANYSDSKIKVYYNLENRGAGYTFRRAIEFSKGEYFGLLGAEDTLTPDALEVMVNSHINNPKASIIYSQYYDCDESLKIQGTSTRNKQIPEGKTYLQLCKNEISSFATFKRKLYNQTLGINPIQRRAIDTDLYLKMEEVGETYFVDKPLYYYRHNSNSISLNDNGHKALMWHISAMMDACERRKLNKEEIIAPYLFEYENQFLNRINSLAESREYKIGSKITRVERFIQKRLRKIGLK